MSNEENFSKLKLKWKSSEKQPQAARSNFFSMSHPSVNSRNTDDLLRRIRSGKDILCGLPSRLDPNLVFSDDEEESTVEIENETPVAGNTPQFRNQPNQFETLENSDRKVNSTSSVDLNRRHVSFNKSAALDSGMKKLFPHSSTKTSSTNLLNPFRMTKAKLPEFKAPLNEPQVLKKASTEETIVVNGKPYQVLSLLGSGGSCKVYSVFDTEKKSLVAIKCVNMKNTDDIIREGFEKEIQYLKQLQNSNRVIRLFDYEHTGEKLFIVLERGDIDLARYLSNEAKLRSLSPLTIKFYWAQMLEAVSDIHQHGIVHSDLKPANFLLVSGDLKLIDFGIATSVPDDNTSAFRDTYIGTLNYMSPEAVTQLSGSDGSQVYFKVGVKSDVWSLGCILYNMVYGETPFQELRSVVQKINAITNPSYQIVFKPVANKLLLDVLQLCLKRNPKERASVDELLRHPYLTEDQVSTTEAVKSKDVQSLMQQMESLTPRRMNYITRVVQKLSDKQK